MKRIMYFAVLFFIFQTVLYLVLCFASLSFNPIEWNEFSRLVYALLFLWLISYCISETEYIDE
jgi:hypothetical protein